MRLISGSLVVTAGLALGGCFSGSDGEGSRDDRFDNPPGTETIPPAATAFRPLFAVTGCATGGTGPCLLPFPTDLFFTGTTDGTLNIPAAAYALATSPLLPALNALDGYSTTAAMTVRFDEGQIDPATLSAANIRIVELYLSNTTKAPASGAELPVGVTSPVRRMLTLGTDFGAAVSTDIDTGGATLQLTPLKPLAPSAGATNIGYLVLLTNGIKSRTGVAAVGDNEYKQIQAAPADCSTITNATLKGVCLLTKAHLQIAAGIGLVPANVVMSFSFSTQATGDTLAVLAQLSTAQPIGAVPTGLTTKQANAQLQGKADIWVGTTQVPYYLTASATPNDNAVLTKFWTAAGPPPVPGLDPNSRNVTRFNPVPLRTSVQTIPLLLTAPNAMANGGAGCMKPASGWPIAIVQHGITGNRTQALAIADGFADACFFVASIDLPLHGVVDATNPFFQAGRERTFNVDLVNNTTSAPGPDGKTDGSGAHFINLTSPLTGRDNPRQAEIDLVVFAKSLVTLDVSGDGVADIDPNRIHFVGLSLGGIVGGTYVKYSAQTRTATLSVAGGKLTQLLLDSPTFGPSIKAGVAALGLTEGTTLFSQFFRDFQCVIDSGDPFNHIAGTNAQKPLHLVQVNGDTVVPNSATQRLVTAAGLKKISTLGPNAVSAGNGVWVAFTKGSHGTLFDPTASLSATIEMQSQTIKFAASAVQPGGPFVVISDPTVIEP